MKFCDKWWLAIIGKHTHALISFNHPENDQSLSSLSAAIALFTKNKKRKPKPNNNQKAHTTQTNTQIKLFFSV